MLCNVVLYVSVNEGDKMNIMWEVKLRSVFQNMYLSNDFTSLFPLDAEENFIQKVEIRCHSLSNDYTLMVTYIMVWLVKDVHHA